MTPNPPAETADSLQRLRVALGPVHVEPARVLTTMLDALQLCYAVKELASARYVFASDAFDALFTGSPPACGASDADLLDDAQAAGLRLAEQGLLAGRGPAKTSHRLELNGVRCDFSVQRVPLGGDHGAPPTHLLVVWQDESTLRQQENLLRATLLQLEQQQLANESLRREAPWPAAGGAAMGLFEHAQFEDQLRREVDLSLREHREFALVSIKLDPLAEAVLRLGAPGRERVLDALGRLLRSNTRVMDASCQIDDERFALLLSGVGLATAHSRMEGLRRQCATQIVAMEGEELGFSISMGVASFPHTASVQADLVAAAEQALAEAIRRGGNQVVLAGIRFDSD